MCCAYLGNPWHWTLTASRAVSNREYRYPRCQWDLVCWLMFHVKVGPTYDDMIFLSLCGLVRFCSNQDFFFWNESRTTQPKRGYVDRGRLILPCPWQKGGGETSAICREALRVVDYVDLIMWYLPLWRHRGRTRVPSDLHLLFFLALISARPFFLYFFRTKLSDLRNFGGRRPFSPETG